MAQANFERAAVYADCADSFQGQAEYWAEQSTAGDHCAHLVAWTVNRFANCKRMERAALRGEA